MIVQYIQLQLVNIQQHREVVDVIQYAACLVYFLRFGLRRNNGLVYQGIVKVNVID